MKGIPVLRATLPILAVFFCAARADNSQPVSNPYLQTDSDGVPLVVTHPEMASLTPEQKESIRKEAEKQDADKDWMMRIYTARMQQRASAHPSSTDQNLFSQLSANKDLARLAGIRSDDSTNDKAGATDDSTAATGTAGKTGGVKPNPTNKLAHAYQFKSLVAPSTTANMFGMHDYFGSSTGKPAAKAAPKKDAIPDLTDIQTPGMLAAKNGPDLGSPDLTLDLLPGESMEQARIDKAHAKSLALPDPLDADPNRVAGVTGNDANKKPAIPTAKIAPDPRNDPSAPIPIISMPVISPVHPAIASPADVLDR